MKHCYFISDLHLSEDNHHLNQLFSHFLRHIAPTAETLYILGDLFEVWIGDDATTHWSDNIAAQLGELAQRGVKIYLMPGNRDFLLGEAFMAKARCQLLPDPTYLECYGKKLLLKHGDDLCTDDWQHQLFRRISRSTIIKRAYYALPLGVRQSVANKIRSLSYRSNQSKSAMRMDVVPQAIHHHLQHTDVDILIHGHTHNPSIHYLWLNNRYYAHLVLADWAKEGNLLYFNEKGMFQLEYFS